jgi:hypothetical protein
MYRVSHIPYFVFLAIGTRWRSWLRHYTASRKVAGSISDEVIGFFNFINPSCRTMALGSTQLLTEMSTGNQPGVKGGRRLWLTTSPPIVSRLSRENVGASTAHNPVGLHGLLQGYLYVFTSIITRPLRQHSLSGSCSTRLRTVLCNLLYQVG